MECLTVTSPKTLQTKTLHKEMHAIHIPEEQAEIIEKQDKMFKKWSESL